MVMTSDQWELVKNNDLLFFTMNRNEKMYYSKNLITFVSIKSTQMKAAVSQSMVTNKERLIKSQSSGLRKQSA